MKKLNLNSFIKVKLTDHGKDIYYHQYDWLKDYIIAPERNLPEVDADGYTEFQLWHFMNLYGEHLFNGYRVVVEDVSIYIDEKNLEEVEEK